MSNSSVSSCDKKETDLPKCKWCGVVGAGACWPGGKGCCDARATRGVLEVMDSGEKGLFPKCVMCGGGRGCTIQGSYCDCPDYEIAGQHKLMEKSTATPLAPFKTHPPMREKMEAAIKQARQFPVMEQPVEEKKEEKEPRMIVRATYTVSNEFRIPRGIDLEDKEQVESWGIKWDMMEIYLQNGNTIKIDPTYCVQDGHDFKRPDETEIDEDDNQEDGDDDVVNRDDDDEDEEEETFDIRTTIVTGIVCSLCKNELPPMTAQAHLEGKFNQTCPHK